MLYQVDQQNSTLTRAFMCECESYGESIEHSVKTDMYKYHRLSSYTLANNICESGVMVLFSFTTIF